MEKTSLPIQLEQGGQQYTGWATPSDDRHPDGYPKSYHVVLNEVFFGDLSHNQGKWLISEPRPHDLVAAVGAAITYIEKGRLQHNHTN
ncbi:MAG: hypothetical protein JST68_29465 [Bacteroidetes bacterium]|nr:hypothetical protein [Bacteroidota bacterium]